MSFILFCICLMGLQAWVEWRFYPCDRMHQACHCPIGRAWRRYEKAAPDCIAQIIRPPIDRLGPTPALAWQSIIDFKRPSDVWDGQVIIPSAIDGMWLQGRPPKRAVIIDHDLIQYDPPGHQPVVQYQQQLDPTRVEVKEALDRFLSRIKEGQLISDWDWLHGLGDEIEENRAAPKIDLTLEQWTGSGYTHHLCKGCGEPKLLGEIRPNFYCFDCQPYRNEMSGKSLELLDEEFMAEIEKKRRAYGV